MIQSQTISKPVGTDERKQIAAQALTAQTPAQIEQTTRDLRDWLAVHPDDIGMEDLFEILALRTP